MLYKQSGKSHALYHNPNNPDGIFFNFIFPWDSTIRVYLDGCGVHSDTTACDLWDETMYFDEIATSKDCKACGEIPDRILVPAILSHDFSFHNYANIRYPDDYLDY